MKHQRFISQPPPPPPALQQAGEVLRPAAVVWHANRHQPRQLQRPAGPRDVARQPHRLPRGTAVLGLLARRVHLAQATVCVGGVKGGAG
jgi:hypothetical protein